VIPKNVALHLRCHKAIVTQPWQGKGVIARNSKGALIPMVLTALKQDPAQSSSIILTTITDVVGFFSFLGIATLLLGVL